MVLVVVAWVGFKEGGLYGKYPCVVHLNESRLRSRYQLHLYDLRMRWVWVDHHFPPRSRQNIWGYPQFLLLELLVLLVTTACLPRRLSCCIVLRFNCIYLYFMQETGEMSVVVADFGLARVLRDRPASPKHHVTSTNWSPSNTSRPLLIPGHKPPPPKKRWPLRDINFQHVFFFVAFFRFSFLFSMSDRDDFLLLTQ